MNFSQLGLAPAQLRSCESLGYTEPTPIQEQGIPVVLSGQDLIFLGERGQAKPRIARMLIGLLDQALPAVAGKFGVRAQRHEHADVEQARHLPQEVGRRCQPEDVRLGSIEVTVSKYVVAPSPSSEMSIASTVVPTTTRMGSPCTNCTILRTTG